MRAILPASLTEALRRTPLLSAAEERELFQRLRRGDRRARERLLLSQLRYVIGIARRYRNHGCPLSDLIQEGVVGLLEAIKRFNPDKGVRLSTFAMWWVRAAIQDYVIRSRSIVRKATTPRHRSMFFNRALADVDASDVARRLAKRFNTTVGDVRSFSVRMRHHDRSLDEVASDGAPFGASLPDPAPDPETQLATKRERTALLERLRAALPLLTRRERHILRRRLLSDKRDSFAKIARDLGLSKERVRQLEHKALRKLRTACT